MIKISRHQNYITLNPKEYLLDEKGKEMEFKTIKEAKEYLKEHKIKNFEGIEFEDEK